MSDATLFTSRPEQAPGGGKPRLAVVSPFLDKRHGTERSIVEQLGRLAPEFEIHVYSGRVEDVDCGALTWHRIPEIPGPHLLKYVWWFLANQVQRWRDVRSVGRSYDLVYSPGVNCWDADVIVAHIVFHAFYAQVRHELRLRSLPPQAWPRAVHRRLYYRLIMALETRIYRNPRVTLAAVSKRTAREIQYYFGSREVHVIQNAVDVSAFNPEIRARRRSEARALLQLMGNDFALLLIGNDWKTKGVDSLLKAAAECSDLPIKVLIAGRDEPGRYLSFIAQAGLETCVCFLGPSSDVIDFYAAADAYVGPSFYDSFGLPIAEAMACGLPVIGSANSGSSEMITHGVDGFILEDPADFQELARLLRCLYADAELRRRMGENAAKTVQKYSWEWNTAEVDRLFRQALEAKKKS